MSKIKLLTIGIVALLAINIVVVGFFILRKPAMLHNDQKVGPKKIIIDRLHFNKEQITAYELLILDHQKNIRELKDSIANTKNTLYQSLISDFAERKDSLMSNLGNLQKRVETVHYDHFLQLKKLCKPEQIQDFNKLTNDLSMYFNHDKKGSTPKP